MLIQKKKIQLKTYLFIFKIAYVIVSKLFAIILCFFFVNVVCACFFRLIFVPLFTHLGVTNVASIINNYFVQMNILEK